MEKSPNIDAENLNLTLQTWAVRLGKDRFMRLIIEVYVADVVSKGWVADLETFERERGISLPQSAIILATKISKNKAALEYCKSKDWDVTDSIFKWLNMEAWWNSCDVPHQLYKLFDVSVKNVKIISYVTSNRITEEKHECYQCTFCGKKEASVIPRNAAFYIDCGGVSRYYSICERFDQELSEFGEVYMLVNYIFSREFIQSLGLDENSAGAVFDLRQQFVLLFLETMNNGESICAILKEERTKIKLEQYVKTVPEKLTITDLKKIIAKRKLYVPKRGTGKRNCLIKADYVKIVKDDISVVEYLNPTL